MNRRKASNEFPKAAGRQRLTAVIADVPNWSRLHRTVFLAQVALCCGPAGLLFFFGSANAARSSAMLDHAALSQLAWAGVGIFAFNGLITLALTLLYRRAPQAHLNRGWVCALIAVGMLEVFIFLYYWGLFSSLILTLAVAVGVIRVIFDRTIGLITLGMSAVGVLILSIGYVTSFAAYAPAVGAANLPVLFEPEAIIVSAIGQIFMLGVLHGVIDLMATRMHVVSATDGLTGLMNRRELMIQLERWHARARQTRDSFSVVMIDVDHFKRINDEYGHHAGDDMLVAIGRELQTAVRANDIVARYGGEEFVALLAESNEENSAAVSKRCADAVRALQVPWESGYIPGPTLSIGIAASSKGNSVDQLLMAADRAMYVSKSSGRDQVTQASSMVYTQTSNANPVDPTVSVPRRVEPDLDPDEPISVTG